MTSISRVSLIALCALFFGVTVYGEISLDPEFRKIEFRPKQKISGAIEVTNRGARDVRVQVQPEDWTDKENAVRGAVSWLKVKPVVFTLKAGAAQKVSFKARMPKDAKEQYVTQLFFATRTAEQVDMGVGVRIAALIHWKKQAIGNRQ